jgi:protocatechuate 3,4-dioxygenase beta subunit
MKFVKFLPLAAVVLNAQSFRVAGVILNSETASPVRKARMTLTASGKTRTFVSGNDGQFEFDVPAGKYALTAEVRDFLERYGRSPGSDFGISVVAGPGQKTDNLTFRWYPPATIWGTVTDQFGQPVEGAHVGLLRSVVLYGRRRVYYYGSRYTDDRGQYYLGPILPGTYYITVTGAPWYAGTAVPIFRGVNREKSNPAAYAAMYYPATHDPRAAAPFIVKPGQEGRADFTLDETHGVTVNVHCEGGPNTKTLILMQEGVNGFQQPARQFSVYAGGTAIPAVAPGRYAVRVSATENGNDLAAFRTIEVGSSDLDVNLTLKPAPSIAGTVEFKDPATRPPGPVAIRFSFDVTGFVFSRTVSPNGSFSATNLSVGRTQVLGVSGDFVSDIFTEDGTPHDGYFDLAPGPPVKIRVVASAATSRVKGFVKLNDQPLEGVIVVLAARDDSEKLANYRAFQTDSDGSFDIRGVRPGDYYFFAVDAPELEWTDPAALRPHFAGAKLIHVDPHRTYEETLSPTAPVRQAVP